MSCGSAAFVLVKRKGWHKLFSWLSTSCDSFSCVISLVSSKILFYRLSLGKGKAVEILNCGEGYETEELVPPPLEVSRAGKALVLGFKYLELEADYWRA